MKHLKKITKEESSGIYKNHWIIRVIGTNPYGLAKGDYINTRTSRINVEQKVDGINILLIGRSK